MDYEVLYDKLYRYCYFRLRHRQDAEDIVQEVLLRSLSPEVSRKAGDSAAYLYTMARNLCIDRLRKKREEALTEQVPAADLMEHTDNRILLETALKKLPEEEQELVFWRYVNGASMGELCRMTGLSRFAVYRRLNRILGKLREELKGGDD